jgi:class 3 adenylate cyclase/tetratricopeptide (TPR) repeat protein
MRCTACGTELLAGKKFCHTCGARAPLVCDGCGASVAPDFRFCPDCGRSLAGADVHDGAPPPADAMPAGPTGRVPAALARRIRAAQEAIEGERKQVTVLFCDLAGSTAIAERLDPEEYRGLLERYLDLVFSEISRFDGLVNHIAGDGVMALFGAPIAHEDAPQRAVSAALAIQEGIARLHAAGHADLAARIGIHTGPVVVGTVGTDLKMDYTAIGDTTNLAARLEALAAPGSVLVSEATLRLVRGFFDVRPTGPLAVRGKADPVVAYEVLGERATATPMTVAADRGLTPLVGRAEEVRQLETCFHRLAAGQPQVVALVGEAGLGKSRLVYELRRRLADEPIVAFEARCSSLGHGIPYAPFLGMMKQYFAFGPHETARSACRKVADRIGKTPQEVARAYPALGRLFALEDVADDGASGAAELQREVFEAIAGIVLGESRHAPVVLLVEDLHWIDDASRELLERLVARLGSAPVMVLVTHRPDDRFAWRTGAALTQLVLRRLADDEIRAVVRAVAGGALPDALERLLVARAEGSPFCAEEVTRALLEEGHLVADATGVRVTRPVEDIPLPGSVQEVIAARLDRLDARAKRVAQVASVLGRQFHRAELRAVLDGEAIDVDAALGELERRGILHRKSLLASDEYRFGESVTQEVAYESLLHRQRRQLHERVAAALETAGAETTAERSALLAHHYARSENRAKAVDALLRAAADANRMPSYRAAVDFYQRAWEAAEACLAETGEERFQRAVLEATHGVAGSAVLFGFPGLDEAERAAVRGREIAEALGDHESLVALYYLLGLITMFGNREGFARGLELAERGLALAHEHGLTLAAMRIARGLAINYALDGRFDVARRAMRWVLDALEADVSHREQRSDLYVSARWVWDNVLLLADDLDAAAASALETYGMAVEAPNRTVTSGAASVLAQIHFLRGEYADALRWADTSLEVGEAIGNVAGFPGPAAIALAARAELGQPGDAERYLALLDEGLGTAGTVQHNFRFVADALAAVGDRERAARFAASLHAHPANVGRLRQTYVGVAVGEVMLELDRLDEAHRAFMQAIALAETIGARSGLALALVGAADVAARRGDDVERDRLLSRTLEPARTLRLGRVLARAARISATRDTVAGGRGTAQA